MSVSSWSEQEALSRNTYKLAQLDPECTAFSRQCHPMFRVSLAGEGSVETWENERSRFSSRKWWNGECETSRQIIRPANPGHSSTSGMILGIWNAVRGARWNQIKTKLRSVRLRAHNPLLSMNFDRYKGNKRRRNRERKRERERYCILDERCSFGQPGSRIWNALTLRKEGRQNYRFYSIKPRLVQQTLSCLVCLCSTQAN